MTSLVSKGLYHDMFAPTRYEVFREFEKSQRGVNRMWQGRQNGNLPQLLPSLLLHHAYLYLSMGKDGFHLDRSCISLDTAHAYLRSPKFSLTDWWPAYSPCHFTSISFPNSHCPHLWPFPSSDLITCVFLTCHCPVTCVHLSFSFGKTGVFSLTLTEN